MRDGCGDGDDIDMMMTAMAVETATISMRLTQPTHAPRATSPTAMGLDESPSGGSKSSYHEGGFKVSQSTLIYHDVCAHAKMFISYLSTIVPVSV